jgi:hypothetical protein
MKKDTHRNERKTKNFIHRDEKDGRDKNDEFRFRTDL